jgi:Di-haem oxidoreductase, putative peroxidase
MHTPEPPRRSLSPRAWAASWLSPTLLVAALLSGCGAGSSGLSGDSVSAPAASSPAGGPSVADSQPASAPGAMSPRVESAALSTPLASPGLLSGASPQSSASPASRAEGPPAPSVAAAAPWTPGSAIAGLTPAQRSLFFDGRDVFTTVETIPNGLGPVFNGKACAECHAAPVVGGTGSRFVTRFGSTAANGVFDPMTNLGGSLLQSSANPGKPVEVLPPAANTVTARRTTTLFGAGLIEAVPDAVLIANANQQAAANPKMAGQVVMVTSVSDGRQHVGRFGWKCQHSSLLDFSGDAFFNEIGVSSSLFPFKNRANQAPRAVALADIDDTPDPTSGLTDHEYTTAFMRYLAPYPNPVVVQDSMDFAPTSPLARGSQLFKSVGCNACHTPFFSAQSPIAALNGKKSWAFSDWLVHDVGTGDRIAQGNAPANKVRTAPLIDVAHTTAYLHDGAALTLLDAVLHHGGEAAPVTAAFKKLSTSDQAALLSFVSSL